MLLWDPVEEEVAEELPEDSVLSEEELPERAIAKEQLVAMPKQERRVKRVRGRFECFISIPPYVEDIILGVFAYRCKKKVPEEKATIVKCARKGVRTMKKASAVLYTIGAILAIFGTLVFLALGIVMKAIPMDKIQEAFNEYSKQDASLTFAKFKEAWDLLGTIFVIAGACSLVGCVLGFIGASFARDPNSSNVVIHIIALIFGIGALDVLLVLGGVFGIVGGATAKKA